MDSRFFAAMADAVAIKNSGTIMQYWNLVKFFCRKNMQNLTFTILICTKSS
jgi:hypothetical protein